MTTVERTHSMPAEPELVWSVLADFGTLARWAPGVDHSCLLAEQHEGVGTVRRVQVGRSTLVESVVAWAPAETLSYEIAGLPFMLEQVTNTWTLEPQTGGTKVTLTTEIDVGSGPLKRMAAKVAGHKFAGASEEMLDGLAEHISTLETP
jgi:carbon monoxide dehydrogenase subunit G